MPVAQRAPKCGGRASACYLQEGREGGSPRAGWGPFLHRSKGDAAYVQRSQKDGGANAASRLLFWRAGAAPLGDVRDERAVPDGLRAVVHRTQDLCGAGGPLRGGDALVAAAHDRRAHPLDRPPDLGAGGRSASAHPRGAGGAPPDNGPRVHRGAARAGAGGDLQVQGRRDAHRAHGHDLNSGAGRHSRGGGCDPGGPPHVHGARRGHGSCPGQRQQGAADGAGGVGSETQQPTQEGKLSGGRIRRGRNQQNRRH
mmetsp:Transcript_16683/g.32251  ORF Transcript_16683/g.32251 Transcript_16683/m.32251 type:complete len:255 (+) Transcript_16683:841-1605(+)